MVYQPPKLQKRQIILGADVDGFETSEQSPVSASVDITAGFFNNQSTGREYVLAAQTVGPFAVVTAPGRGRWDLVYLDDTGTAQVEAGVEQVLPVAAYTGAPGSAGAFAAADVYPIAYVYVDEAAGVLVDDADITPIRGYMRNSERGVVGSLATDDGTGAGGILGTNWTRVPIDHRHPPNVDGVNPADISDNTPAPGVADIYGRRDHVHQVPAASMLWGPKDRATTCLFAPMSNVGGANVGVEFWRLHRFQGRAYNDPKHWFNIDIPTVDDLLLDLWPVDAGGTGNNIGPGAADDTDAVQAAVINDWLYVYVIAVPYTGTNALVYSTNAPAVGPGLTNVAFTGPGYSVWRWVACIEMSNTLGLPVASRKFDNLVIKDWPTGMVPGGVNTGGHAEDLYWNANFGPLNVSLAEHVSPMAMAVFINWALRATPAGGVSTGTLTIALPNNTVMGRQDRPDAHPGTEYKGLVISAEVADTVAKWEFDGCWFSLDAGRLFEITFAIANTSDVGGTVIAYMETDNHIIAGNNW